MVAGVSVRPSTQAIELIRQPSAVRVNCVAPGKRAPFPSIELDFL
jgi:hypothetical protein